MSREKQNTPTNTPTCTNLHQPCNRVQVEEMIEYLNNTINVERNSYFGKGCITLPLIEADKILDILKGYRKQEWISVDERLPEREGKYLVCTANGNIGVGNFIDYYGKGTHLCFDCWVVTHWMPLPEAPKMKGGAE